jgi:DNA-binding NtrC family response regulator
MAGMYAVPAPVCLIAEDQALIAMSLESDLEEVGIKIAGPFASCAQALGWVEGHTPQLALLDFRLKDGPCTELARMLRQRDVPVLIYSGLPPGPAVPPELRDLPWIEKPVERDELIQALMQLLSVKLNGAAGASGAGRPLAACRSAH